MAGEKGAEQVDVEMGLAQTEIEAGNPDKAWLHMQRIIGYENDTIETGNRFIDLAQKGNKLPEAMEWVRQLLKEHPYSLLYWKMLVELAEAAACYEQALEACEFALAIAPDDLETLKNKFNLFENVDTEESRLAFYLQMEKIAVENGDEGFQAAVMLRVAQEYELDSAWEQAEIYYHRLSDVPAIRQYALFRLGVIADFRRSYASSLAYFKQALEAGEPGEEEQGNRAKIYRGAARTYFNMGHVEEGLKYSRIRSTVFTSMPMWPTGSTKVGTGRYMPFCTVRNLPESKRRNFFLQELCSLTIRVRKKRPYVCLRLHSEPMNARCATCPKSFPALWKKTTR